MGIRSGICALAFIVLCCCFSCDGYAEQRSFAELAKRYRKLKEHCTYHEESVYEYRNLTEISEINNGQPEGYLVRLAFYAMANNDAHVIFATNDHPDRADNAYEIVIGGWGNTRSVIRRQMQGKHLAEVETLNILANRTPLKVLVDIKTDGEIKVWIEHEKHPIATWKDSSPLPIKYFGFAAWNTVARYFYNCRGDEPYIHDVSPFLGVGYVGTTTQISKINPLLNDPDLPPNINKGDLLSMTCAYASNNKNYEYGPFVPLTRIYDSRPPGFIVRIPVYVQADKEAHMILSNRPNPGRGDPVYEFLIGGWGGNEPTNPNHVKIRRKLNDDGLADVIVVNLITAERPTKFIIEITDDGYIRLYTEADKDHPIARAFDPEPLDVNYLAFGANAGVNVTFYYNCPTGQSLLDAAANIQTPRSHPLLNDPELPPNINKRDLLKLKCSYSYNNKNYEYGPFVSLDRIRDSRPPGFIARIAVYVQADKEAHMLLSNGPNPGRGDPVYEFLFGGWGGNEPSIHNRVKIRRKLNDDVLADVIVEKSITAERLTKIIIEVTDAGRIRVYTEANKYHPIAMASDAEPLDIKYLAFGANEGVKVEFFYNCPF